jgi:hypothetical protein
MAKNKKFFDLEEWRNYWQNGGKDLYRRTRLFDVKASAVAVIILLIGMFVVPQFKIPALVISMIIGLITPVAYTYLEYKKLKQKQMPPIERSER